MKVNFIKAKLNYIGNSRASKHSVCFFGKSGCLAIKCIKGLK